MSKLRMGSSARFCVAVLLVLGAGCGHGARVPLAHACLAQLAPAPVAAERYRLPRAYVQGERIGWEALAERLARYRAVLIAEQHDRYDHHLNQLETLCRLQRRGVALALGLEAFQQPFQPVLDAYVAGEVDLAGLLERTEYFERWRFDHRLYSPLLDFARRHAIPLVALNVPQEVTRRLGDMPDARLSAGEQGYFPFGLGAPEPAYRARVRGLFKAHPQSEGGPGRERFTRVQWLWDQAMGQRAARYLLEHPERTLVLVAGSGHVAFADAIPERMAQALDAGGRSVAVARVLQSAASAPGDGGMFTPTHSAVVRAEDDVRLESEPLELPRAGRLGVALEAADGSLAVASVAEGGAAGTAGIRIGDRLVTIASVPVRTYGGVRLALAHARPGDTVEVGVRRAGTTALRFDVTLR